MILYGNKVKLTGIELKDQIMLNDLMNDPSAEEGIESAFWPISQYQQEKWFMENYKNTDCRRLAIRERVNDNIVGLVSVYKCDYKNRKCGNGIKLMGGFRGQGYASDALNAILKFIFLELNFNRVETVILDKNIPSQKLYESKGFVREGVMRKSAYKNGEYRNQYMYGLLKEDFIKRFS